MDALEITKRDDNTINVVKSVPVQFSFTPEYLVEQRGRIVAQKERDNAQRDLEIAEVDVYLAECAKLGVVVKPVEKPVDEKPLEELPSGDKI
jgi:hypothetical protein